MTKFIDMTGKRVGKLTVLKYIGNDKDNRALFLCKCDCGNIVEKTGRSLRYGYGSCGCVRVEVMRQNRKLSAHPADHGMTNTRLFRIWSGMKDRCNNPNNKDYHNYGDRGIVLCDEWQNDFMNFYEWAQENNYQEDLTIDRIDVNGNYEPSNCRWATIKEQLNNTRYNVYLTHNGRTQSMKMWAEELGFDYTLVRDRHKRHKDWTFEQLFAPIKNKKK